MARVRCFAIKDSKIGSYVLTFNSLTEGSAMRSVQDLVHTPNHQFNVHADDFELWEIGTFDEESGALAPVELRCVCNLVTLK